MDIKEFKRKAKPLDAKIGKVVSQYWGKTWWDVTINAPSAVISFQFEENQPLRQIVVAVNHSHYTTAEKLAKTGEIFLQVSELMGDINAL